MRKAAWVSREQELFRSFMGLLNGDIHSGYNSWCTYFPAIALARFSLIQGVIVGLSISTNVGYRCQEEKKQS